MEGQGRKDGFIKIEFIRDLDGMKIHANHINDEDFLNAITYLVMILASCRDKEGGEVNLARIDEEIRSRIEYMQEKGQKLRKSSRYPDDLVEIDDVPENIRHLLPGNIE